ncbi:NAD(P)/FAD-dependent oxidoreductase [Micromonospora sp. WMMD1082]|uniref:NAD(P)/FAD-dependent oxidoreductase n=1 Tax=Micromonospora sp. WMMD1082 TaxID=3016104 RepID=UPI002417E1D3|nr:NAD(P)/FAD-dependent oxidoreductase [Micromonospora sp. WMMD1082]MDG4795588.1 NAD(P)/FAD-dependent oxidoreductase [Micromonospora sp. WMMD1082]
MLDVIVVGAGPAGLTAAQVLGRQGRVTLVIDSGQPRNAPAGALHMFPSRDGLPPTDLRSLARAELAAYPAVRVVDSEVTEVRRDGDRFEVDLAGGEQHTTRRLLLATGLVDEMPEIGGFAERFGVSIFHCPYCHGNEVRGKAIAVVSGCNPMGFGQALYLRDRFTKNVVLLTHGSAELSSAQDMALKELGIPVRREPVTAIDGELDALTVRFASGEPIECQAVFHRPPERVRNGLAAALGCEILSDGWVKVDAQQRTSVPGVYAAGDMAREEAVPFLHTFVLTGAASGQIAGVTLDGDLFLANHPTVFGARPRE